MEKIVNGIVFSKMHAHQRSLRRCETKNEHADGATIENDLDSHPSTHTHTVSLFFSCQDDSDSTDEMGLFLFCTFLFIALAIFACSACHSSGTLFFILTPHTPPPPRPHTHLYGFTFDDMGRKLPLAISEEEITTKHKDF